MISKQVVVDRGCVQSSLQLTVAPNVSVAALASSSLVEGRLAMDITL